MRQFELANIPSLRESNRLEAKSAKGGFPNSFWETYSAFANSDGGFILLGVTENKDGSLQVDGNLNIDKLRKDFWNLVNNRQKVSVNILTDSMVRVEEYEGRQFLSVRVPRAERTVKPVYVGLDPKSGTYRRNHDGDYHCSVDEVALMFRDASSSSVDSKIMLNMGMDVFCMDTIRAYRNIFRASNPSHLWSDEDDEMFLRKIGATALGEDGQYHPTAAGLLMFGYEYEIVREFPNYFLDYQENRSLAATRWTDRVTSQSGDWSGNVFDFVRKVLPKLHEGLKIPFVLDGNSRVDDTPLHKTLREALTNTLVHADYYGRQGVVVQKWADKFRFSNPGTVRISIPEAVGGGISDPRNNTVLKMFAMIDFGERAGSGLSSVCHIWEKVYHVKPKVEETHANGVDRTSLMLSSEECEMDMTAMLNLYKTSGGVQNGVQNGVQSGGGVQNDVQNRIMAIIHGNASVSRRHIAEELGISLKTLERRLKEMGLRWVGGSRNGHWER